MKKSYTKIEKLKIIVFVVAVVLMTILIFKYDYVSNIVLIISLSMIVQNKIRDSKKAKKRDYLSIGLWILLTFVALIITVRDFINLST
ncbi:hypothetical protein ACIQXI_05415 [Lysinibacillus sp. NPDC097195]|uniref:hypothetical protein n=1 Tax=Lysinibacillus sp. NPDC097195 TaxID=3364141 RepID=UPI003814BAE4